MSEMSFYRNRAETIRTFHGFSNTGYNNRGQISPDDDRDVVATYAQLGFAHARELEAALDELDLLNNQRSIDVLDIGCGLGITRAVLKDRGLKLKSYAGIDANEEMLWMAQQIDSFGDFWTDFSTVGQKSGTVFVLFNHVLGQDSVSHVQIKDWVTQLKKICLSEVRVLSIEPARFQPSKQGRATLERALSAIGFRALQKTERVIPGEFKDQKSIVSWTAQS